MFTKELKMFQKYRNMMLPDAELYPTYFLLEITEVLAEYNHDVESQKECVDEIASSTDAEDVLEAKKDVEVYNDILAKWQPIINMVGKTTEGWIILKAAEFVEYYTHQPVLVTTDLDEAIHAFEFFNALDIIQNEGVAA